MNDSKAIAEAEELVQTWVDRSSDECFCVPIREQIKLDQMIAERFAAFYAENARLREALEDLERVSGHAMISEDPVRVRARAALEGK